MIYHTEGYREARALFNFTCLILTFFSGEVFGRGHTPLWYTIPIILELMALGYWTSSPYGVRS